MFLLVLIHWQTVAYVSLLFWYSANRGVAWRQVNWLLCLPFIVTSHSQLTHLRKHQFTCDPVWNYLQGWIRTALKLIPQTFSVPLIDSEARKGQTNGAKEGLWKCLLTLSHIGFMDVQHVGHFVSENVKSVHMTFKTAFQSAKKKGKKAILGEKLGFFYSAWNLKADS